MTSERGDLRDETRVLVERGDERHVGTPGDENLRISPLDRGFLYGDGVFETVRCYEAEPAFVGRHAERLNDALDAVGIERSFAPSDFEEAIEETVSEDWQEEDAYFRVTITRGERHGLLEPTETEPTVVWTAKPLDHRGRRYPPASVETVETRRPLGALGRHKTLNYLPNVLARSEASESADEALMLDADGKVGSGAVSNVFVVDETDEGVSVRTPAENVREGVTREVVLEVAEELGLETREADVPPAELENADAVFLTNTTWGVRKVNEIDGESAPSHEAVGRIATTYLERALPSD